MAPFPVPVWECVYKQCWIIPVSLATTAVRRSLAAVRHALAATKSFTVSIFFWCYHERYHTNFSQIFFDRSLLLYDRLHNVRRVAFRRLYCVYYVTADVIPTYFIIHPNISISSIHKQTKQNTHMSLYYIKAFLRLTSLGTSGAVINT